jgi:transketolase
MRNSFAKDLESMIARFPDIFLLYGDIGNKLFDDFKGANPQSYSNVGVAESNMVTVAAGMAKSGFLPVVYTINSFLSLKTLEQIKLDVCYPNLPVVMVGTGGGLSYAELGATHHSLEDFAILSVLPNLEVFAPADPTELSQSLELAFSLQKPCYIRIGKKGETSFIEKNRLDVEFQGVNKVVLSPNTQNLIVSTGTVGGNVFSAIESTQSESNLDFEFWTIPRVKKIPESELASMFARFNKIMVVEEHNSFGGLGSIISYKNSVNYSKFIKFRFLNTGDSFHSGMGNLENARAQLGLDPISIKETILDFFG